jgi:hypothetical protein
MMTAMQDVVSVVGGRPGRQWAEETLQQGGWPARVDSMWPCTVCLAALVGTTLMAAPGSARADDNAAAPIEAAKLEEVEHYQVSINTPDFRLTSIEPLVIEDGMVDEYAFASDFSLDLASRRAALRLAGYDNELALAWDMRAKSLRVRLAGGHLRTFFIAIDGDVILKRKPEIDARLILAIAGQKLELDLPRFRVDAKLRDGDVQMEVVVPLIQGGF